MFAGKVVIVTGASSGIGAATALMFCREGASVALVGRNQEKLSKVSDQCTKAGGSHIIIRADVANDEDAKRIVKETVNKFNKLDVVVNNAGIWTHGTIINGNTIEAYDKIMPINLRAAVHLTVLACPYLIESKGNIINISSIAGQKVLNAESTAYCVSKAGLDHFTRCSAMELAGTGVRVNAISPGPVATDLLANSGIDMDEFVTGLEPPLGRISQSDEIADMVQFLASDKARAITGSIYVTDNGLLVKHL